MRLGVAASLSIIVLISVVPLAAAHDPTEGENEFADDATALFYAGAGAIGQTWLTTPFENAAESSWATGNNSQAVRYLRSSSGAEVRYRTNAQTPSTPECTDAFWYACTDYTSTGAWLYTVFNSAQNAGGPHLPWYWCEDPAMPNDDCTTIGRITMHEIGHAAGLSRMSNGHVHQPTSAASSSTSMQALPAWSPDARYDDVILGSCDEFELQREYDVDNLTGTYAACTDHAVGTGYVGGEIETVATRTSPASVTVCVNDSATLTGSLTLSGGTGLGRLAANVLPGRAVSVQRSAPGGTFSTIATVTTNNSGNFSRTVVSSVVATWWYRASFADSAEVPLDGDVSGTMAVSWVTSGCPQ